MFIAYKVITKLPSLVKEYRNLRTKNSLFLWNAKRSIEEHLPDNRMEQIMLTELAMYNYSLFSWKKKARIRIGQSFTYHKKTSVTAVYIMLIHATVVESIGLHYLLHSWNE